MYCLFCVGILELLDCDAHSKDKLDSAEVFSGRMKEKTRKTRNDVLSV